MSAIAVVGVKGAPGASTVACVLAAVWPADRRVVVAECDPGGGDIAARFGLSAELGTASLAAALRRGDGDGSDAAVVGDHLQVLPGGLEALVGPVGADAATAVDRELAAVGLVQRVTGSDLDLVADCGRLQPTAPGQMALIADSAQVVLCFRPDASSLAQARWAVSRLGSVHPCGRQAVVAAPVGRGPLRPHECADALGVDLVACVPDDREAAAMVRGEPGSARALARSALVRAGHQALRNLVERSSARELANVG
jgi:hypothetical protein